jgi:hypothetical protein
MHVPQLLDAFALRPDVEVVEPLLPDVLRNAIEKPGLRRIAFPFLLGQHSPRKSNFDRLNHSGWIFQLRFADQEMDVLRHDHVAHDYELIPLARLFEDGQEKIKTAWSSEQRLAVITTEGEKVQVSGAVVTLQISPHGCRLSTRPVWRGDCAHRAMVMKDYYRDRIGGPLLEKAREGAHPLFCLSVDSREDKVELYFPGLKWPTRRQALCSLADRGTLRCIRPFHEFPHNRKNREHHDQIRRVDGGNRQCGNPPGTPGDKQNQGDMKSREDGHGAPKPRPTQFSAGNAILSLPQ